MSGMRLIAGSGRSGTTWVQDALATANDLRPVFEPLHPAVSNIGARYAYRALAADEDHPELERFLLEACAGRRHAMWTRFRGRPDLMLPPLAQLTTVDAVKQLHYLWRKFFREMPELAIVGWRSTPLLKCIRVNLMLAWMSRRFLCKTVLIVRHPGAVVESQSRLGAIWDPEPVLQRYRVDSRLHELTRHRYRALLERRLSRVEALTANWIIENQWAIEQAAVNGVTVVFYERLKASPACEWKRVARALELPSVPDAAVLERPSQQSSGNPPPGVERPSDEPRWLRSLSPEQVAQIQGVLDEAHFDLYTMTDTEPHDAIESADCGQTMASAK